MMRRFFRLRRPVLVPLIIAINIFVFFLWSLPGWEFFMRENFTVSFTALIEGRWWTAVTAVFSHNWVVHLLINMFVLNSFGGLLEQILGRWRFLNLYFFAGVVSSLAHALVSALYLGYPELAAVGASGAIAGLVMVFSLMFPREKILLFGIVPMPALVGALAFIGLDLWGLTAQAEGGGLPIGHGAHLGGAFAGLLFYVFSIRGQTRSL